MQQLTYYVACSVDGFIAHEDGSLDGFLQEGEYLAALAKAFPETFPAPFRDALGIDQPNRRFDTVLMGRHTYEVGQQVGLTNPYPQMKQYLISRSLTESPDKNVELVSEGVVDFVDALKQQAGKGIWLCGGGQLAATLFRAGLIDRLILKVNPFVMGAGIQLFGDKVETTVLALEESTLYENGVTVLNYRVGGLREGQSWLDHE